MGVSILSPRCKKCCLVDTCDHKEIVAVAYLPGPNMTHNFISNLPTMTKSNMREIVPVNINGQILPAYKDELEKDIYKKLLDKIAVDISRMSCRPIR